MRTWTAGRLTSSLAFWAALAAGAPLSAAALEVELTVDGRAAERVAVRYACSDGLERSVAYLNRDPVRLAVVPATADETLVFVNVVAASGSRYVAGTWEWWSKGDAATLSSVTDPDTPAVTCTERGG